MSLVKSAKRTVDVLELLVANPTGLSLSDMADRLGIPISSMHALVTTLEKMGYIIRDLKSPSYQVGPRFVRLAVAYTNHGDLPGLAAPILDRLAKASEESVVMSILLGNEVVYVSNRQRQSASASLAVNAVGSSLPAHATGSGKAMLAYLPDEEFERIYPHDSLPRLTANTITTKSKLKEAILEARERGYAYDEEESERGVWAVVGCVRNAIGRPSAAVGIAVPTARLDEARIPYWTELVLDACNELSSRLGFSSESVVR